MKWLKAARFSVNQQVAQVSKLLAAISVGVLLVGCAVSPISPYDVDSLPPLLVEGREVTVKDATRRAPTPKLLSLDDEMRAFVSRYAGDAAGARQRLRLLHESLIGAGTLNIQYDPFADGTARQAFHRGSANCLAYANLFVAMAREAGLEASYQWVDMRPQWSRMGERVAVRLHINTLVELPHGVQYMVDIDPLLSRDVAGTRVISDRQAEALYHNNIAMAALADEDAEMAWMHAIQAISLDPEQSHLWVNLGAIYRLNRQHRAAETSYLRALELDPRERSAMNNLSVLYGIEGREEEREYWVERVQRHRHANPYYHAWLGDQAASAGDWQGALVHYRKAVRLLPEDSHLLYARGVAHQELGELAQAHRYLQRAVERAPLRSEVEMYRARLHSVEQAIANQP